MMNREIKFRGKRIDNNQIIFGCLVNNMWTYSELSQFEKGTKVCEIFTGEYGSDNWIDAVEQDNFIFSVYPQSVSQYTGLKDKNGVEIYEGDITKDKYVIMFHKEKALFAEHFYSNFQNTWNLSSYPISSQGIEIIGNLPENPELLNQ